MPSRQMRASVASSVGKCGMACAAAELASVAHARRDRERRCRRAMAILELVRGTQQKQKATGGESDRRPRSNLASRLCSLFLGSGLAPPVRDIRPGDPKWLV